MYQGFFYAPKVHHVISFFNIVPIKESRDISRKAFMQRVILAGVAVQLPWLISCENSEEDTEAPLKLTWKQAILDHLIPADQHGPGAIDFLADKYIDWYLNDKLIDPSDRDYVANGFKKFEDQFDTKAFEDMNASKREAIIQEAYDTSWGKSWLSRIMTLSFEAMLTHPLYKGNPERIGWEWLEHTPGQPEPNENIMYPKIFSTIHES